MCSFPEDGDGKANDGTDYEDGAEADIATYHHVEENHIEDGVVELRKGVNPI